MCNVLFNLGKTFTSGLEQQLSRANEHLDEYKAMANSFEQNIKEQNEVCINT